ncbi:hypothetical protein [Rhizobium sp. RU36D]|uniref:hypothetical protein n=1 Tax=Rhizobium sp. RU36D TaxID=1907415 RepID=UPI0009D84FDF|nr:hypothetical protein [Rhizobium sp. RU36D]SMD16354.1 hypothetical protein SAMN05880593_12957 [Rhizobium sp. RU36D]
MKYPSEEIDSRPNIRILETHGFDFTDGEADHGLYKYNTVYNESGQIDEYLMPEFGLTRVPVGGRTPLFLPLKKTRFEWPVERSEPVLRSREDQYHEGEFWKESVRAPKVVYDLEHLGIDVGRDVILDRRSEGY